MKKMLAMVTTFRHSLEMRRMHKGALMCGASAQKSQSEHERIKLHEVD
jgi:hypothetical protein